MEFLDTVGGTEVMRIRAVIDTAGLESMESAWDGLVAESGIENVFLSWDWITSWWSCYGRGSRLVTLLGFDEQGKLRGIAPLHIRIRPFLGMNLRSVEFVGSGEITPDHLCFICAPEWRADFFAAVFLYLRGMSRDWDQLRFTDMLEDPDSVTAARQYRVGTVSSNFRGVCPYITLPSSWQEYFSSRSARFRRNFGATERELAQRFTMRFSMCGSREELGSLMSELERIHRKRMAEKNFGDSEASLQAVFWRFQSMAASRLLDKGRLFTGSVTLNGVVAACLYGFISGRKVEVYQSGLDPAYARYSIGFLLFSYLVREAINRGASEFDFLRGDEAYKFHFTDRIRRNMECTVRNRNPAAMIAATVSVPAYSMKRIIQWTRSAYST